MCLSRRFKERPLVFLSQYTSLQRAKIISKNAVTGCLQIASHRVVLQRAPIRTHIDRKISQTMHINFSEAYRSHQAAHVPISVATVSYSTQFWHRKLEQEKIAMFQNLSQLIPTSKRRSGLTLKRTILKKVQFRLHTMKEKPGKIRHLLDILDHRINRRGQRSEKREQRCKNAF